MAYLCLYNATEIYTHLRPFDPHTRRTIFSTMCGFNPLLTSLSPPSTPINSPIPNTSQHSPLPYLVNLHSPLTVENQTSLGPSLVRAAVQRIKGRRGCGRECEGWCVDHVWLELQLILDEWEVVEKGVGAQGVRIVLAHFAEGKNWTVHTVFSRLLRRMGSEFQVCFWIACVNAAYRVSS